MVSFTWHQTRWASEGQTDIKSPTGSPNHAVMYHICSAVFFFNLGSSTSLNNDLRAKCDKNELNLSSS